MNKVKCQFGCCMCKGRVARAIRAMVHVAGRVLDWSNPALVWTLRAYRGADTARRRAGCPKSVKSTARKVVCRPSGNKPAAGRFPGGKA